MDDDDESDDYVYPGYGNGCFLSPVGCRCNGPWYDKDGRQLREPPEPFVCR